MSAASAVARTVQDTGIAVQTALPTREAFRLSGRAPEAVVYPETPEQVAQFLALAHSAGWGVVPWGAGQGVSAGRLPTRYEVALSLSHLNRVLEHDVENLTLTAQAGLALTEANRRLAKGHQFAALGDDHELHTLGGIVASNRPVPRRMLYGDVRDQLLGLTVATSDGRLVRYGRKVIKNVAGYDMNKLFTGSTGMLGVIVDVTLKLFAIPDERAVAVARFPDSPAGQAGALAAAAELYRSALAPAYLLILENVDAAIPARPANSSVRRGLTWLCVGVEGRAVGVRRQTVDALALMARHGGGDGHVLPNLPAAALNLPTLENADQGIQLRAGTAPERLGGLADELLHLADIVGSKLTRSVDYGAGLLRCYLGDAAGDSWLAGLQRLRASLEAERGYLLIERAPSLVMEHLGPWGELGGEAALMRILRQKMDPKGILAPGRYL